MEVDLGKDIVWILVPVIIIMALLVFYVYRLRSKNKGYEEKLSGIVSIEDEVAKIAADKVALEKSIADLHQEYEKKVEEQTAKIDLEKKSLEESIAELRQSYKEKKSLFDELVSHAAIYDESIELAELGFYKPHYDFDTSEKYKNEIDSVREVQKEMIREKTAITCNMEWTVEGSRAKGCQISSKTDPHCHLKLTHLL